MAEPRAATASAVHPAALPAAEWHSDATPAEVHHFAALTSTAQLWGYLRRLAQRYPRRVRLEVVGRSERGVPLVAVRVGDAAAPLRALLFAQQHGNEPAGKEACLLLARELAAGALAPLLERLVVWLVPQVNPDGAAAQQRLNAAGLDLNRQHPLLRAPEQRALYGLFHRVRPHLTIDLHELCVEKARFAPYGIMAAHDLMAEGPTHLNLSAEFRALGQRVLEHVGRRLHEQGFAFHRYLVHREVTGPLAEVLRYSTLDVDDGRNTPALFGTLAFLTEAMRHRDPLARLERRVRATLAAVVAILEYAGAHADGIRVQVAAERARLAAWTDAPVVLRSCYRAAVREPPLRVAYRDLATGREGEYVLPQARIAPRVVLARPLPAAYWLDPLALGLAGPPLLAALAGHGVRLTRLAAPRQARVAVCTVHATALGDRGRRQARVRRRARTALLPAGALLLDPRQHGGLLAALLLEPEATDGLLARGLWDAAPGTPYPVRHVLAWALDPARTAPRGHGRAAGAVPDPVS
ncbi:MAG TPA: M14 family zinc carboxypeptidase [Chloroflexota bacterium]|jgi:hypothetical protein|nr:M14 family zinc carboxypeptidase [Chloroflexota bacterium]